jgi:hypothetical protein
VLEYWNAPQRVAPLPDVSKDSLTGHPQGGWRQEGHLAVKFCTRVTTEHRNGDHNGVIAALAGGLLGRVRC